MESNFIKQQREYKSFGVERPRIKKVYTIPPISEKKKQQLKEERPDRDLKQNWFTDRRKDLTGICGCGCGQPSQKNSDEFFRHSCCHIFPKALFPSIAYHPLNFIERAFIGGCHTNMDEQGIDKWRGMEDWEIIKQRAKILAPLVTREERSKKFYGLLMDLIERDDTRA